MHPAENFRQAMFNEGQPINESIIVDGEIHRFKSDGDKHPSSWYWFNGIAGSFGNWRKQLSVKWHAHGATSTDDKLRLKIQKQLAQQKRQREAKQLQAKRTAQQTWGNAEPINSHPYLDLKNVDSYGLRTLDGRLVVPAFIDKEIHSLQFIDNEGGKRFLTGGRIKGGYFPIGKPAQRIWLAEGYATSATVREATGEAVVVGFNAGNIIPVSGYILRKLPGIKLFIAADNDEVGITNADSAVSVGAAGRISPIVEDGISDWNDYSQRYGIEATREALREVFQ